MARMGRPLRRAVGEKGDERPPPRGGVGIDSRTVKAGDLFVALKGDRQDGHDFLKVAAARGAAGALVSRPVENLPDGFGCDSRGRHC
jgi:UDP-N-acetylmuramyl pentapeptide synthase